MMKRFVKPAVIAFVLGAMLPLSIAVAKADDSIEIDELGHVIVKYDHEEKSKITALQLSLKIEADPDAEISFDFNPENGMKISEYLYHEDTKCLNIYMADATSGFESLDSLDIGTVSAKDADGNAVDVKVDVVKNSLKYIHGDTLEESTEETTEEIATTTETTEEIATTTEATEEIATTTETTEEITTTTETIEETTTTTETTAETTTTTETTEETTTTTETTAETTTTTETTEETTTTTETTAETTTTTETTVETTTTNATHVASDKDLCDWAIHDYEEKTGVVVNKAEITTTINEDAKEQYDITLSDDTGNVLDVYTIDPNTGVGVNSANEEVNLPQTGNNSMTNILVALGAFLLAGIGFCTVKFSGVMNRKKNEE
ncbi:MAG: LPXTG cell wall anchor domain-containing protein [Oscillospiraceae bacterium]|nr:LPXTG cell wall anchor domain-containing protein [Oscillospiraceae bacterium]